MKTIQKIRRAHRRWRRPDKGFPISEGLYWGDVYAGSAKGSIQPYCVHAQNCQPVLIIAFLFEQLELSYMLPSEVIRVSRCDAWFTLRLKGRSKQLSLSGEVFTLCHASMHICVMMI